MVGEWFVVGVVVDVEMDEDDDDDDDCVENWSDARAKTTSPLLCGTIVNGGNVLTGFGGGEVNQVRRASNGFKIEWVDDDDDAVAVKRCRGGCCLTPPRISLPNPRVTKPPTLSNWGSGGGVRRRCANDAGGVI